MNALLAREGEGVEAPHCTPAGEVVRSLGSDVRRGLGEQEAVARLERFGPNRLERAKRPAYAAIALRQFLDPLVALLLVAAAVSLAIGEGIDAAVIGAIVVLNAVLGFAQEAGAERAVLALREALQRWASVVRDGREGEVPVEQLVPGDLIVVREGERVPADARLVEAHGLAVDESILTGESMPVEKTSEPVAAAAPLAEQASMVHAGTAATRGRARAVVTATADATEVGQIAELAAHAKPPPTPLQRRVHGLTRVMVVLGAAITLALAGILYLRGSPLEEAFLIGVAVAVAAVPEGLAATVTIALALGARAMAARGAIVRRLPAVETLGSATVIASDKTGTLTENRLRLAAAAPAAGSGENELLAGAVLASAAELVLEQGVARAIGDPVEGALLVAAHERELDPIRLRKERELVHVVPFEAERRRMSVVYAEPLGSRVFVKGAPEVVLARSEAAEGERERLEELAERWATEGLRVLAVAERTLDGPLPHEDVLEQSLRPLGLVALYDPLRERAEESVRRARDAGIRVRILTGDHPVTAGAVGRALHLPEEAISARVTPADKLRIVEELQAAGEVVAVTGDGVNDAAALRRADVGVAMGRSGTEAAREAADLVLTDDDFSTIVAAVEEGRRITDNVRKFVAFLLSANLGEVVLFAIAIPAGLGAPMTVIQVLTVNILTDGLPAVALASDPAAPEVMRRRPVGAGALFPRRVWAALALVGMLVGLSALGSFLVGRALGGGVAQTMAFATVALSELVLVFSARTYRAPAWLAPRNAFLLVAVALSLALLVLVLYVPALRDVFGTVALDGAELGIVVGLAVVPAAVVELAKAVLRRRR